MNSVNNFRKLSEAFVRQYLCSARHKQNINTLQNIKIQENESMREFVNWFRQTTYKFLKGISTRVRPSLNLSPRNLQQLWMIFSNEQTNISCLRTMSAQLLSRSWSPVNLPETTKLGVPKPRANGGRWVGRQVGNSNQTKPISVPSTFHMKSSSP